MRRALACALAAVGMLCSLAACSAAPDVRIDAGSPALEATSIAAGSELDEGSQYVEARLSFDALLQAADGVLDDLDIRLDGEAPDARTVDATATVDGSDLVVRLKPSASAAGGGSVYFALHDGQLSVAARNRDGSLPHVRAQGGSTAMLAQPATFTVPTGMRIGAESVQGDEVSFDLVQFAQLRCCAWFSFADGLPLVKLHNHAFYRDTNATAADRLVQTVNSNYADSFTASCQGSRVTVRCLVDGAVLDARIMEGPQVDLSGDASAGGDDQAERWE